MEMPQVDVCVTRHAYGIHSFEEIFWDSIFFIVAITLWRKLFTRYIARGLGDRYARREYGEIKQPDFIENDKNKHWKITVLDDFCEMTKPDEKTTKKAIKRVQRLQSPKFKSYNPNNNTSNEQSNYNNSTQQSFNSTNNSSYTNNDSGDSSNGSNGSNGSSDWEKLDNDNINNKNINTNLKTTEKTLHINGKIRKKQHIKKNLPEDSKVESEGENNTPSNELTESITSPKHNTNDKQHIKLQGQTNLNSNDSNNNEDYYPKKEVEDVIAEMVLGKLRRNDNGAMKSLCEQLGYTFSQIREYWQYRRKIEEAKTHSHKYCEELWKCTTMFCVTVYGISVIYNKPFFYDTSLPWIKWPQSEPWDMKLYYQIAAGYHGHRALFQFLDAKRGDFWAMFVHHWVTVGLIISSWHYGIMEIGVIVMVCHDNADIFLPAAKISDWERVKWLKDTFFAIFVSSWVGCRILLFSWKVIYPVLFYGHDTYGCRAIQYNLIVGCLIILLGLHLYWFKLIATVAITRFCLGGSVVDIRSDDEDDKE